VEQGYGPKIIEAYTWPEHAPNLDPCTNESGTHAPHLMSTTWMRRRARNQVKSNLRADDRNARLPDAHARPQRIPPDRRTRSSPKRATNILRRALRSGGTVGAGRWRSSPTPIIYTQQSRTGQGVARHTGTAGPRPGPVQGGRVRPSRRAAATPHWGTYRGKPALVDDIAGNE